MKKRFLMSLIAVCTAILLLTPFAAADRNDCTAVEVFKRVDAGQVWVVAETTCLNGLFLEEGATVTAPAGYSLSLTVNGVETGSQLATTAGVETEIAPGNFSGAIVLTVE